MPPGRVRGGGVPSRPRGEGSGEGRASLALAGRALWTLVSSERRQLPSPCSLAPPAKEGGASHVVVYGPRQRPSCWASAPPPHPHCTHTHTHTRTWHLGGRAQCWKPCQPASGSHLPGAAADRLGSWEGAWGEVLEPSRRTWPEASSSWGRPGGWGQVGRFNPFLPSRPQPSALSLLWEAQPGDGARGEEQ